MSKEQKTKRRHRNNKYKAIWRSANREKYRAIARESTRRWRKNNPDKNLESSKLSSTNRRAWKRQSGEHVSSEHLKTFGNVCAYCRQAKPLGMDHFVALSSGGAHKLSNLVPCCRNCNSSKRNSNPFDWMEAHSVDADLVVSLLCETRHALA
jgi:5-methylcytosine-specific restriction endonuclease McrA